MSTGPSRVAPSSSDDSHISRLLGNEERLRMAMAAANIGAFDWDIRAGEIIWSANLERMMGLPPGGFGKTVEQFLAFVHPDDLATVQQLMDRALRTGEEYEAEFRMIRADGRERWCQARGQVHFGDDGKPSRVVGIDIDITEKHRREEQLRQSLQALRSNEEEARAHAAELRAILDAIPALLFVAQDPGCLKMTSSRDTYHALRLAPGSNSSKSAPENERPQNFRVVHAGREISPEDLPVQQAARTGLEIRDCELTLEFDDGSNIDLLGNAVPLFGNDGKVRGAVGAFIDVTSRRRWENSLRREEEELRASLAAQERERKLAADALHATAKFRAVFDQSAQFAGIMTAQGILIEANQMSLEVCGYKAEEVLGLAFWKTPWWRHDAGVQEKMRVATLRAAQGVSYREELSYAWADGSVRVVDFALHPIRDEQGRILFLQPTGVDITDRKQSEREIQRLTENLEKEVFQRTQELRYSSADVLRQSQLLSELSQRLLDLQDSERRYISRELHDSVGSLLAVLCIDLEHVSRRLQQAAPELRSQLDGCHQIAQQIVREIRTMSYLFHPPLLDEVGLLSALEFYIEGVVSRTGLQVSLNISQDFPRFKQDLETAVFRVVQECLTNIHRHSGSKTASVALSADDRAISLVVADAGKGISPEKLAEINSHGSGIGVQSIRERLRPYKGDLQIASGSAGTTLKATFLIPQPPPNPA